MITRSGEDRTVGHHRFAQQNQISTGGNQGYDRMKLRVADIIQVLEQWAPSAVAGRMGQFGTLYREPADSGQRGVLVCLDCTPEVIEEAVAGGLNMIVSHHPLIFKGLKHLREETPGGTVRSPGRAEQYGGVFHAYQCRQDHGWVSGAMARALELQNVSILAPDPGCHSDPSTCGLGVVGDLPRAMATEDFFTLLKKPFPGTLQSFCCFSFPHFKSGSLRGKRIFSYSFCIRLGSPGGKWLVPTLVIMLILKQFHI